MTDNSRRTGAAIEAHNQFLMWLVPTIKRFPKSHKFMIGEKARRFSVMQTIDHGSLCHFAVMQPFGRSRSKADIQRAALTEPDL